MRWLVIDSNCTPSPASAGVLSVPGTLSSHSSVVADFSGMDVANRIIIDIGIDGLHWPSIGAV